MPADFDMLYQRYTNGELTEPICKFALLKFWAENMQNNAEIPEDAIRQFVQELLNEEVYFPFYVKLVPLVPELHYIKDSILLSIAHSHTAKCIYTMRLMMALSRNSLC